jgi:hypothetical protein
VQTHQPVQALALLGAKRTTGVIVVDDWLSGQSRVEEARAEHEPREQRRSLGEHPIGDSQQHEVPPVAHVVGTDALLPASGRPALARAARLVVEDRELAEHVHVPAARASGVLIDAVPAHRRAQATDRLEAIHPVCLGGTVDVVSADVVGRPALAVEGGRLSTDDAGTGNACECFCHPLEVMGGQHDVAVHLHHDLRAPAQLGEPGVEGTHDLRAACPRRGGLAGVDHGDPGMGGRVAFGDRARLIARAVVYDDPLRRPVQLRDDRVGRVREVLGLVAHGRDDRVAGQPGWAHGHASLTVTPEQRSTRG